MAKKVDIIDVRNAIRSGKLKVSMVQGILLLEDISSGERVTLSGAIVPCIQCEHYVWNSYGDGCWVCTKHGKYGFRPNDFCSYGERKDNDCK